MMSFTTCSMHATHNGCKIWRPSRQVGCRPRLWMWCTEYWSCYVGGRVGTSPYKITYREHQNIVFPPNDHVTYMYIIQVSKETTAPPATSVVPRAFAVVTSAKFQYKITFSLRSAPFQQENEVPLQEQSFIPDSLFQKAILSPMGRCSLCAHK